MNGIEIRAESQRLVGDTEIAKLTVTVSMIPASIEEALGLHLMEEARQWLLKEGLITKEVIDLTAQGPMQ